MLRTLKHCMKFSDGDDHDDDVFIVVDMGCTESTKGADSPEPCKDPALQLDVVDDSYSPPAQLEPGDGEAHELLSADERAVLKADWSRLAGVDQQDMGMRTFLRIFELEPSTKQSFPELVDLQGDELKANTLFRCHGARFMRAVAAAVDNVDALDLVVIPNLIQLGRLHKTVFGLSWCHLIAFEQAMAEVWAAEMDVTGSWSGSTSAVVWAKVFRLITSKVYEGFQLSSERGSITTVKDDQKTAKDECACQLPRA